MIHRTLEIIATLPPLTWLTLNVVAPLDRRLMRASGGRLSLTGASTILLVTKGARSGELRFASLPGLYHDDAIVLLASKGGSKTHPAWYHNLAKCPAVEIIRNGEKLAYRAEIMSGARRQDMWEFLLAQWSGFAAYQEKARPRVLPIVVLRPMTEA